MGKSRKIAQHIPVRTAWPVWNPIEPMTGDFGILSTPQDRLIAKHENQFTHLYQQSLLEGNFNSLAWHNWCTSTNIPWTPWHERSAVLAGKQLLPLTLMSDLCEDYIPHIGSFIDDFLWTGDTTSSHRILGGAIASTLPLLKHGHCALYKASEQHPRLPQTQHQSLTPHYRTPTMLWKKSNRSAEPLLPLAEQYHPTDVVNLDSISSNLFIAKILFINETWTAHLITPINVHQDELQPQLQARLLIAWFRYRRHNSKLCYEDILRERSDILYRTYSELLNNS